MILFSIVGNSLNEIDSLIKDEFIKQNSSFLTKKERLLKIRNNLKEAIDLIEEEIDQNC